MVDVTNVMMLRVLPEYFEQAAARLQQSCHPVF